MKGGYSRSSTIHNLFELFHIHFGMETRGSHVLCGSAPPPLTVLCFQ